MQTGDTENNTSFAALSLHLKTMTTDCKWFTMLYRKA